MVISGSHVIKEPATEFFAYAALMLFVMVVFIVMAMNYKYVDEKTFAYVNSHEESNDSQEMDEKKSSKTMISE